VGKQKPGFFPVTSHGSLPDTESAPDFRVRHTAGKAHFDNLGKPCIDKAQPFHGAADRMDFFTPEVGRGRDLSLEFQVCGAPAVYPGISPPNGIDHYVAHEARGIAEKSEPIGCALPAGLSEAHIRLVDQCGGIEQSIAAETEAGSGNSSELEVDRRWHVVLRILAGS
jgi:hypothetical protein